MCISGNVVSVAAPLYDTFARLARVQTELRNAVDAALRSQHGVPLPLVTALDVVASTPGCRVQDVVTTLHITVGGASKVVDRLVDAGHVVRTANPADRRSSLLTLTPDGTDLLRRALATVETVLHERLRLPLAPAALAALDRSLRGLEGPGGRTAG